MSGIGDPPFVPAKTMERLMEQELLAAGLMPTRDHPILDIEAFLESHLRVKINQYADLPADELGVTTFEAGKPPFVEINKDLTGAADEDGRGSIVGRWRITLAHEGAHVILHREAMERIFKQPSLFDDQIAAPVAAQQRCLKRDLARTKVNPWEYQANYCMAALLMPRPVFAAVAAPMFSLPAIANCHVDDPRLGLIIDEIAGIFQVSRSAARIRIQTLGIQAIAQQTELSLV